MMKFKTLEAARGFFNTMHIEHEEEVKGAEAFYDLRTYDVTIEEIDVPVKVTVGCGGDFFIMTQDGLFSDESTVSDTCKPLPQKIQDLVRSAVFKGYTPIAMLLAIHEHRLDDGTPQEEPIETSFRLTIRQLEEMLRFLV